MTTPTTSPEAAPGLHRAPIPPGMTEADVLAYLSFLAHEARYVANLIGYRDGRGHMVVPEDIPEVNAVIDYGTADFSRVLPVLRAVGIRSGEMVEAGR